MPVSMPQLHSAHIGELTRRHDKLLEEHGFDHLIVYSGAPAGHFLDDNVHRFVVNPHFKWWAPLTDYAHSFLVYPAGGRPRLLLHRPEDFWHGTLEAPAEPWTEHFDVEFFADPDAARALLPPANAVCAFIGEWETRFAEWPVGDPNPVALLDALHYQRAWKTDYELACMRKANATAARAHRAARRGFEAGASELEIHFDYCRACGVAETELPYTNIIALNEHCAVLHYHGRDHEPPSERRSFLIDAGAGHAGYASDVTRTYAADDGEFAALIRAVDERQQALCVGVKPGADFRELHLDAHLKIAEVLHEAEIVRLAPETIVATGLSAVFYPHGLGHYIGLQVHDVGAFFADADGTQIPRPDGHPFLRLTRTLEAGQVTTIEPGLYFIPALLETARAGEHARHLDWKRIESLAAFGGVRIEDDVAVTDEGHENLTRGAFADSGAGA